MLALRGRLPAGGVTLLQLGWLLAAVGVATVTLTERAIARAPSLLPLFETHEGFLLLGQCFTVLVVCGIAVAATAVVPPGHPGRARRRGRSDRPGPDLGRPRRRALALGARSTSVTSGSM